LLGNKTDFDHSVYMNMKQSR